MILYVYDVLLHVTLIFFILSMFFYFFARNTIQKKFDEKTEIINFIVQDRNVKEQRERQNNMWWRKIIFMNISLISLTILLTCVISLLHTNGYDAFKVFASNIFNSMAVLLIQIYMFKKLNNFSSLSPIDFEIAVLNAFDDLITQQ